MSIEKAMVIISSISKPLQSLDQRIRQAFADHGVKMPEMNTNDLEDCSKINSNDSVQLPEMPQTSEEPSLACFFSPSCITAKVHEIVSSFLP
ncbi:hypothetical protein G9C98_004434 [Cotesia typhae]|uniref:Uncharacterized protein n=1 Tax=Cotesia typhae TaxID=2053667 RepID=A0A8J5UR65_9HYME|nr:hypothetical protein G9C98_004434 [Cotesia typhae]